MPAEGSTSSELRRDGDLGRLVIPFFLAVLVALGLSAAVGIQLFQDGSSYLLEILVSHPHTAVRHHRFSALLVQAPVTIFNRAARHGLDDAERVKMVRIVFCAAYASVPLVALIASWLVVRKERPDLFIWPATIVLLVNLVNFSSVSELIIAMQAACPLMLAAYIDPASPRSRLLAILTVPLIFFLHALGAVLLLAIAAGLAIVARRRPDAKRPALIMAGVLTAAALLRVAASFWTLNPYERDLLEPAHATDYMVVTTIENVAFLIAACLGPIALAMWRTRWRRPALAAATVAILGIAAVRMPDNLRSLDHWGAWGLLSISAAAAVVNFTRRDAGGSSPTAFPLAAGLLWTAALLSMSQYFAQSIHFPLKTGLAILAAVILTVAAAFDSTRRIEPVETSWRSGFLLNAAGIFVVVTLCKSLIWNAAMERLRDGLDAAAESCVERNDAQFAWLDHGSAAILDNWALTSLALVEWRGERARLLLDPEACADYYETGAIRVDPWTVVRREHLPFIFGRAPR